MKKCDTNMPNSMVADKIKNHQIADLYPGKCETQQEVINRLEFSNRVLEIKQFGDTRGYGVVGVSPEQFITKKTFTSESKEAFVKKMGEQKAEEINKAPTSILQRDLGTYIHLQMEDLMNALSVGEFKDKVLIKAGNYKTVSQLRSETKLSEENFNVLYKTAKKLIESGIAEQNKKDPTGKVYISAEQRLIASSSLGGTSDLVFVYSDVTTDNFDYKTMTTKYGDVRFDKGKAQIVNPSWIPTYKYEDWNLQLPKTTFALEKIIGVKQNNKCRIIPIAMVLEYKDDIPTGKIKQIETFVSASDYLKQIPIKEKTGIGSLDESIEKLNRLKENYVFEASKGISRERREFLKTRIDRQTRAINAIIVDQDISNLIDDYTAVVKKYADVETKDYAVLKNITQETIEDKVNSNYLSLEEHRDLLKELGLISSIIAGSYEFYDRMGIDESEYNKYRSKLRTLQNQILVLNEQLQNELFARIKLDKVSIDEIKNSFTIKTIDQMFNTFGEIQHPVFREAFKKKSMAESEARLKLQKFKVNLEEVSVELEKWGKNNGLGLFGAYDKLINKATGNIYAKNNAEFTKRLEEAQQKKDAKFIDKYFKPKDNAKSELTKFILRVVERNNLIPGKDDDRINQILEDNTVEGYKFNDRFFFKYYELKPEYTKSLSPEVYSKEYIEIQSTPAIKKYYDFWIKTMQEFREITDMSNDYTALPDNFIPNFRAGLIEQMFQGGLPSAAWESFIGIFRQQSDDIEFGYMTELAKKKDIDTGEILHEIPLFGLYPIYNRQNVIDNKLKSFDLTRVLYTFADIAYNYEGLKKIEAEITVLGDMIATFDITKKDSNGKIIKTLGGAYSKLTGKQLTEYQTYLNTIKYHVYGIKEQGDILNNDATRVVNKLNDLQRASKMMFEPVIQISASLSSKVMSYYEGVKGYYYDRNQMLKSESMLASVFTENGKLTTAILQYFEFSDKYVGVKANELPSNFLIRLANKGLGYIGFRKGSEWIDNSIGLSMMQNYGIDENGKIRRLKMLPKGSKSLLERASLKDGKLEIEGITLDNYNWFTQSVKKVSRSIKGEISDKDQRAINYTMLGKLAMTYKNWLPDLWKEHMGSVQYNNYTDTVVIGRFNSIYQNLKDDESKKFLLLNQAAWIGIGKLLLDVPLSLIPKVGYRFSKTNTARARALFEKFKQDNPNDPRIQEYTFEEFLDYYDGQIKAGVQELSIYLALIGLVLLVGGDWDDDGKDDYKQYLALSFTYKIMNRMRRELGFFLGSEGVDIALNTTIPVTGLGLDIKRSIQNFVDEAYNDITGTPDPYDQSGYLHHMSKIIPIVNPARKFLDKERES
jgi:hypothetical protein